MKRLAALLALVGLLVPAGTASARIAQASAPGTIQHIVLIVDENHNATAAITGMPYLKNLGTTYTHDWTSYSAIGHPSLPNYLALTEGNTGDPVSYLGTDCGTSTTNCMQVDENIYHQADEAGLGWNQWSESMPVNCDPKNASPYVVHHAPAPFYADLVQTDCQTQDVRFFESAPPQITAGFTFLTPNLNHDAHNGSLSEANTWLKVVVPKLMAQPAYQDGSTLIEITFDEGSSGNNHVALVLVNPALKGHTITVTSNHYSLLQLNEELLGLPFTGNAQTATSIASQVPVS